MTDMDSKQSIPSGFLSFSLVAQEIISVLFAFYSYQSGEMALATFYLGVAGILLVGLGIHSIFDRPALVRGLLAAVLIVTFFYLLSTVPDSSVLLWCLTIIPVLVGTFGSRVSMIILASIFAATLWLFFGNSGFISPDVYSEVVIARFLSAFAVLSLCHCHGQLPLTEPAPVQRSLSESRSNRPPRSAHTTPEQTRYGAPAREKISAVPAD
ncbi:MAG: hypothetical protein MUQ60_07190 [Porticoccaceae bacterium]|nr:hypothetical protein [Porticoccaceae bacterium]